MPQTDVTVTHRSMSPLALDLPYYPPLEQNSHLLQDDKKGFPCAGVLLICTIHLEYMPL